MGRIGGSFRGEREVDRLDEEEGDHDDLDHRVLDALKVEDQILKK
jgi:hypothetical protein